ncbi:MAG: TIGR03016 family PEP-CTERM system-associated outer membrane protein [Gammaproteobacteria bacterium]|nr:TIGR03016 family PEP-CTERM system-associated outer membrane protein [Gammaproteobacteria bacterium]
MGVMVITSFIKLLANNQGGFSNRIRYALRVFIGLHCILFSCVCFASGWEIKPGILLTEIYTDNIALANDAEKESEFVTQVVPGIKLSRQTKRFDFELDYNAEALFYHDIADRNQVFHQLSSSLASELIDNFFFIDGLLGYSQVIIDPTATVPTSNVTSTENRTDVATASIHPYLRRNFNDDYLLIAGTTSSVINYQEKVTEDGADVKDIYRDNDEFSLEKLPGQSDWRWKLSYSSEIEKEDRTTILDYEVSQLDLYYALTGKLEIFAEGGKETDLFTQTINDSEIRETFWMAGFGFNSRRTSLEMAAGERTYGRTRRFRWERVSKILTTALSYNEGIESFARQRSQIQSGAIGLAAPDPAIELELNGLASSRSDIFLEKTSQADFSFDFSKTLLNVFYSKIERDFFVVDDDETEESAGLVWMWNYTPFDRIRFGVQRIRYTQLGEDVNTVFDSSSIRYERTIGHRVNVFSEYVWSDRETGDDLSGAVNTSDYVENRVSAGIGYRF